MQAWACHRVGSQILVCGCLKIIREPISVVECCNLIAHLRASDSALMRTRSSGALNKNSSPPAYKVDSGVKTAFPILAPTINRTYKCATGC